MNLSNLVLGGEVQEKSKKESWDNPNKCPNGHTEIDRFMDESGEFIVELLFCKICKAEGFSMCY